MQLARLTRAGFSTPGPGKLPLDDHLATVLQMASIHWILMPTRLAGKSAQPTAEDHESSLRPMCLRLHRLPRDSQNAKSCVVSCRKGFAEGCRGPEQMSLYAMATIWALVPMSGQSATRASMCAVALAVSRRNILSCSAQGSRSRD